MIYHKEAMCVTTIQVRGRTPSAPEAPCPFLAQPRVTMVTMDFALWPRSRPVQKLRGTHCALAASNACQCLCSLRFSSDLFLWLATACLEAWL